VPQPSPDAFTAAKTVDSTYYGDPNERNGVVRALLSKLWTVPFGARLRPLALAIGRDLR